MGTGIEDGSMNGKPEQEQKMIIETKSENSDRKVGTGIVSGNRNRKMEASGTVLSVPSTYTVQNGAPVHVCVC